MRFDVFTLFPDFFASPLRSSILKRGQKSGALQIGVHDIRDYAAGKHRVCDDAPYGGGAGMVMKAEPIARALENVLELEAGSQSCPIVLMSPQGRRFSQSVARELCEYSRLALLCGHYEGIDERVVETFVTHEISVGDYVLTGGETAALVVIDAVARLVPNVLGNAESAARDSFSNGWLEAPHYTRPATWRGKSVPEVLLSGHHEEIEAWRKREGFYRTRLRRPDLLEGVEFDAETRAMLMKLDAIEE